jgi:hypothetical protein
MAAKSDKAELKRRVEEVFKLRLGGANFADIVQYASAQSWGVSERQLRNYIEAAHRLIVERFDARAPYLLARHLLRRDQLYAHAVAAGDFRTALAVSQDEAKLEGLYPKPGDELRGEIEELKRLLQEAKATDGDGGGGAEGGGGPAETGDSGAGGAPRPGPAAG